MRVPVATVFDASTVAALAVRIALGVDDRPRIALVARERPDRVPLSLAQQRMWFLNQFDIDSALNNIPVAIRLSGDLDVTALQSAVDDVIGRHESLRTVYPEVDGVGYQVIVPAAEVVPDLTPFECSDGEVFDRVRDIVASTFDVTTEVPFRLGC